MVVGAFAEVHRGSGSGEVVDETFLAGVGTQVRVERQIRSMRLGLDNGTSGLLTETLTGKIVGFLPDALNHRKPYSRSPEGHIMPYAGSIIIGEVIIEESDGTMLNIPYGNIVLPTSCEDYSYTLHQAGAKPEMLEP